MRSPPESAAESASLTSVPPPSIAPKAKTNPLDLSVWEKFRVRLTMLYGAVILVTLGALTAKAPRHMPSTFASR